MRVDAESWPLRRAIVKGRRVKDGRSTKEVRLRVARAWDRFWDTSACTKHDRGKEVRIVMASSTDAMDASKDSTEAVARQQEIEHLIGRPRPSMFRMLLNVLPVIIMCAANLCIIMGGVLFIGLAGGGALAYVTGLPFGYAVGAAIVLLVLLGFAHHHTGARWWNERHTRRVLSSTLTERHCAACQYDLRSLEPDQDGCTVCPECGSAWDLDDWLSPVRRGETDQKSSPETSHPSITTAGGATTKLRADLDGSTVWSDVLNALPLLLRWKARGDVEWGVVMVGCVAGVAGFAYLVLTAQGEEILIALPVAVMLIVCAIGLNRLWTYRAVSKYAGALIAEGVCPACGGALRKALTRRYREHCCEQCRETWRARM